MPTVTYVLADGSRRSVDLTLGTSLMEGATGHAIPGVLGDCGGSCACATCHLYVDDLRVNATFPVTELEDDLLNGVAAERRPSSRLGCQVTVAAEFDGLEVTVPECQT